MKRGILAGIVGGRRRAGLGEQWDSRYHLYHHLPSGRLWRYRPILRIRRSDRAVSAPAEREPIQLRLAS